jgi:hypothetical protein
MLYLQQNSVHASGTAPQTLALQTAHKKLEGLSNAPQYIVKPALHRYAQPNTIKQYTPPRPVVMPDMQHAAARVVLCRYQ